VLLTTTLPGCAGCGPGAAAAPLAEAPEYRPGSGRCADGPDGLRPLVVEWPAVDRGSLEARLRRGMVAVRYRGCEFEVLRDCRVDGDYGYAGFTRKREQILIANADELYTLLPVGAVRLEAKLARAGRLRVDMTVVGMFEAGAAERSISDLSGRCEGATHVITGVQVGAFEFFAGGEAEVGAGARVAGAGAGARSTASHEVLNSDGQAVACEGATTADGRPPEGCGALLRLELTPISRQPRPPACPSGTEWDGARCTVTTVYCPPGTRVLDGRCVQVPVATPPASPPAPKTSPPPVPAPSPAPEAHPEDVVCSPFCDRSLACQAEANGVALPEGEALRRLRDVCLRGCRRLSNDYTRPQLRQCLARKTCAAFNECIAPDDDDW
jgi:hypothetical protein